MSITSTTQKPPADPAICFCGLAIPYEILTHEIFYRVANTPAIHSLLLTNRNINKLVLDNNELWASLWEKRFPGSHDPIQKGFSPIEAYKGILPLLNGIKSNFGLCELHEFTGEFFVVRMLPENDRLILFFNPEIFPHSNNIGILDLNSLKKMKIPTSIKEAVTSKVARVVIHKDTLCLATLPYINNDDWRVYIRAFDLNTGEEKNLDNAGQEPVAKITDTCFVLSNQGNLLYLIYRGNPSTMKIWDLSTGGQLQDQTIIDQGYRAVPALPYNDSLILADENGNIKIWNYKTQKEPNIFKVHKSEIKIMRIYQDKLISVDYKGRFVAFDLTNQKKLYSFKEKTPIVGSLLGYAGMVFSCLGFSQIQIRDAETNEVLGMREEGKLASDPYHLSQIPGWSILAVAKSKLIFGYKNSVKIFDFDFNCANYEQKIKKSLTDPLETKDCVELLMLAVMKKDREEILEWVNKLVAADPRNKEFIEILCETTEGDSSHIYELSTGTAFDYKKTIQSAPLYLIENAVSEFTSKLKTDRNIQLNLIKFDQTPQLEMVKVSQQPRQIPNF